MNAQAEEYGSNHPVEVQLKATRYDQVTSLLVSLLILIGVSVMLLFIVWATQTFVLGRGDIIVRPAKPSSRQSDAVGFGQVMETVGLEELPELTEPQLAVALQAVTDAVSTVVVSLDAPELPPVIPGGGKGPGKGRTRSTNPEDEIDDANDDENDDVIPRWQRWQVRWTSSGLPAYRRQLDFFKIELGAAGGTPLVDYASDVSKAPPKRKMGRSQDEKRLFMTWKGGTLSNFDKQILNEAGIPTKHRVMLQFYPKKVEDRLASLELENAKNNGHDSVKEFQKTFFGVRRKGRGYEFFVEDQEFRTVPNKL